MAMYNGNAGGASEDDAKDAEGLHRLCVTTWTMRHEVGEWVGTLASDTPLRFDTAYIRHPECVDGEWNCRWLEYVEWTNYYGERVPYKRLPKRSQFNTEYLKWDLQHHKLTPKMTVSFAPVLPDAPGSPMMTHVDFLEDTVNLDAAEEDRLLTRRRSEGEPGVFAIIERTTGVVFPIAEGLTLTVDRRVQGKVSLDLDYVDEVEAAAENARIGSWNGFEKYEYGKPEVSAEETYRDIERWSSELARHIDDGKRNPRFAGLRRAVERLEGKTAEYDRINR